MKFHFLNEVAALKIHKNLTINPIQLNLKPIL